MRYSDLDKAALQTEFDRVKTDYEALRGNKLNLNLTRGKPETAQLALSDEMFHSLDDGNFVCDGIDARNYGELAGLPACRKLFAEILACKPEEVILGNNASLNLMYDLIAKAMRSYIRLTSSQKRIPTGCSVACAPGRRRKRSSSFVPSPAMTVILT